MSKKRPNSTPQRGNQGSAPRRRRAATSPAPGRSSKPPTFGEHGELVFDGTVDGMRIKVYGPKTAAQMVDELNAAAARAAFVVRSS